jgi:methylglutamate dehydrogenase subunit D
MADRQSALAHLRHESAGESHAMLAERRPGSLAMVTAWPETVSKVEAALSELLGVKAPAAGNAALSEATTVAAIGAGRFFIATEATDLAQRLESALLSADAAITDLAHGRTILRLEGEAAAEILSRCVAIDLDLGVFPVGRAAQTMIHHVDVLIVRRAEQSFDLWVLRSFAEALAEWVLDAGLEPGIAFQG